ncbi:MAG: hypothetical protein HLUCCO16_15590 [Phormidium sp. OSCR]|nr:MAG: hypothetical protein HLUCCO16_15590 [Phormidium sp. OSCR]
MTRFIHDQFAKDYLEELLTPYGTIQSPRRVAGEVRQIDLWFSPNPEPRLSPDTLGLLARTLNHPAIFEPYRNPVTASEIRDCVLKLLVIAAELEREARRQQTQLPDSRQPHLWILTPTASDNLLDGFGATLERETWGDGIYHLAPRWRTAIIVIHQLPRHLDTLWLRVLGRGRVQQQAIDELGQLSPDNPFRRNALMLLNRLKADLETNNSPNPEDRELIMRLSPLFDQQLEAAQLSGRQQGLEQGREQERREAIASLLETRFGPLDNELSQLLDILIQRPSSEIMPRLLQLSREELTEQFKSP